MSSICQAYLESPACYITLRERIPLALAVACANVYGGYKTMAHRDLFVQPYQFDPVSNPEGEAPEEIQTLWLQQDVSKWLVCLNNVKHSFR